jgi:hypothetical protein
MKTVLIRTMGLLVLVVAGCCTHRPVPQNVSFGQLEPIMALIPIGTPTEQAKQKMETLGFKCYFRSTVRTCTIGLDGFVNPTNLPKHTLLDPVDVPKYTDALFCVYPDRITPTGKAEDWMVYLCLRTNQVWTYKNSLFIRRD